MNTAEKRDRCATVAAVGMFDGVHLGHCRVLGRLRDEAAARSMQSLALTFSRHPLELVDAARAPRLLTDAATRVSLLLSLGIDRAEILDFTPELRALRGADFLCMLHRRYGVAALVMGYNNHIGCDRLDATAAAALTPSTGVEIIRVEKYAPADAGTPSSTAVRTALGEGRVDDAARLLGRYYAAEGPVIGGNRIGRTIDFPTANVDAPAAGAVADGAYAVDVEIDGDGIRRRGMADIGRRPTLGNSGERRLEVNIFGLSADLYGHRLRVEFLQRLRDERAFASLDELKEQLARDRKQSAAITRNDF